MTKWLKINLTVLGLLPGREEPCFSTRIDKPNDSKRATNIAQRHVIAWITPACIWIAFAAPIRGAFCVEESIKELWNADIVFVCWARSRGAIAARGSSERMAECRPMKSCGVWCAFTLDKLTSNSWPSIHKRSSLMFTRPEVVKPRCTHYEQYCMHAPSFATATSVIENGKSTGRFFSASCTLTRACLFRQPAMLNL